MIPRGAGGRLGASARPGPHLGMRTTPAERSPSFGCSFFRSGVVNFGRVFGFGEGCGGAAGTNENRRAVAPRDADIRDLISRAAGDADNCGCDADRRRSPARWVISGTPTA